MSEAEKRFPELRFKGFVDAWEQRKLKDVAPLQRGFDLPKSKINKGPYPVLFSNGIGGWNSEYKAKAPGVVTGRSGSIGNVAYIEQNYWPHNTSLWVTSFFDNYPRYVYYLYQHIDLSKFGTGSGVPTLNRNDVHEYSVVIPKPEEQARIANFFKSIDDTIALHQRKLTLLKQLKQTYLRLMFPQNEEYSPVLRFASFSEPWEQRKLGELANIVGGGTPSTGIDEYWDGDIDWYSPVEIGNQLFVKGSQKRITEAGLQKSSAKILPVGTVLFTSRAGIGKTAILAKEGATNQGFQSIVPDQSKLDSYFIYSKTHKLKQYGETNGAGSTFIEVSGKQMAKMPILIPPLEEQTKIGFFFKQLDNSIDLQQGKLEKLLELKQILLGKMFL